MNATLRTVYLIGGPRDGAKTLTGGVSLADLTNNAYITGKTDEGEEYLYAIIGPDKSGELMAVCV